MNASMLPSLGRIAREAGRRLVEDRKKGLTPELKGEGPDVSFVSEANRRSEAYLRAALAELAPQAAFVGEESAGERPQAGRPFWAVDPLDGTHAFLLGLPSWGVSIGGFDGHGQPVAGAIYLPVSDQLFLGTTAGSTLNGAAIRASSQMTTWTETLFMQSDLHLGWDWQWPGKIRGLGSAVAHLSYAAAGIAAGAVTQAYVWDIGAALAILPGAGAELRYLDGSPVDALALTDRRMMPMPAIACHPALFAGIRDSMVRRPDKK